LKGDPGISLTASQGEKRRSVRILLISNFLKDFGRGKKISEGDHREENGASGNGGQKEPGGYIEEDKHSGEWKVWKRSP